MEGNVQELLDHDVTDDVNRPTPWVIPVEIVAKANGEIRLCIDMRRANKAVVRGRHHIPTIDEYKQHVWLKLVGS